MTTLPPTKAVDLTDIEAKVLDGANIETKDLDSADIQKAKEKEDAENLKTSFMPEGTSREDQSGFFSSWTMSFMNNILQTGSRSTLVQAELGPINFADKCLNIQVSFDKYWELEQKKPLKTQSLWLVLWRTVGWTTIFSATLYYLFYAGITFGPVLILNALVQHVQKTNILSTGLLWFLVAMIFALPMAGSLFSAKSNVIMAHISVQFRNVLVNKIYRKAILLSPAARQKSSTGQIITMFSNDTKQLQLFLFFMNNALVAPFQIIVALALIYQQVGVVMFIGFGFMIILIPLNGFIFVALNMIRRKKVKVTDARVKLTNEVLAGIRVIKYYAWELPFTEKIAVIRNLELQLLKQMAYIVAVGFTLILQAAPIIQPILIFFVYIKLGNSLDAATAFTTISLFNIMQAPFAFLPLGLAQYSQSLVSTKRMLDFFNAQELTQYVIKDEGDNGTVVSMESVSMSWILDEVPVTTADKVIEEKSTAVASEKENKEIKKEDKVDGASTEEKSSEPIEERKENAVEVETKEGETKEGEQEEQTVHRPAHTLNNINFKIKKGQVVAIVGTVGCGKSSLLSGLLGEMQLVEGVVRVAGSVAYCDLRPWILNTTVKENILFGEEYDEDRFNRAIKAACLEDDVRILPGGILTEIGERGINLSGGQKSRVALARAVYRDADIYLLDDPLSAVDAHVGQQIFNECILGTLRSKTVVLVTHQIHLLHHCDLIIVLDHGEIKACGTYDELQNSDIDITAFVKKSATELEQANAVLESNNIHTTVASTKEYHESYKSISSKSKDRFPSPTSKSRSGSMESSHSMRAISAKMSSYKERYLKNTQSGLAAEEDEDAVDEVQVIMALPAGKNDVQKLSLSGKDVSTKGKSLKAIEKEKAPNTLTTIEEKAVGDVMWCTYSYYIKAGGLGKFFMVMLFICLYQALTVVASYWLAYWGTVDNRSKRNGNPLTSEENTYYLNYYALYTMMGVIALTVRAITLAQHRLGTSVLMHEELVDSVLGAGVAFFDVTPQGRLLNRFSSDMVIIDEELSQSISQLTNSLFSVFGAIAAIAAATQGIFLILCVPLVFLYEKIQRYFRKSNTAIARLQSVSLSPIYTDFSQALTGLSTIRAYGVGQRFVDSLQKRVDYNTVPLIMTQLAIQWLAIRLDFIGSMISFFIAVLAIASNGLIPASFLALGLTYSFQMTTYLKFAVRMIATAEAQMNSVERVKYYIDTIEQEDEGTLKGPDGKDVIVPDEWPAQGTVTGKGVQMRYRDGPLVLKGVDFQVKGGEKIGIAGRTGSGKSSLMIGLFRIQELALGCITIDGLDTKTIPLRTLRSRLGIIPQDPVLFSASVRFNLDPFTKHTDAEIWSVLDQVNMKDHVTTLPGKLSEEVAEGGDNFSTGQRQLICIARALLRKPKILVLDEATASIDNETDEMIQRMVRVNFKDCTVLTIAHRLNTIIDSDRVIVMDAGLMAEFGPPEALLKNEEGAFKSLWDKHQKSHEDDNSRGSRQDLASMVEEAK